VISFSLLVFAYFSFQIICESALFGAKTFWQKRLGGAIDSQTRRDKDFSAKLKAITQLIFDYIIE
jgi:hypothetical protein